MSPTSIVAYLALFAGVGFLFLFVALLVGRFVRADVPSPEKQEAYECGERPIGSSFVQFDLRFYVVALVFIIFDLEVAFFFPWATVFGKATQLMDRNLPAARASQHPDGTVQATLNEPVRRKLRELGVTRPTLPAPDADAAENNRLVADDARRLAVASMADIGVFFAVLMVGFAYVWRRGDLAWVRAMGDRHPTWNVLDEQNSTTPTRW